MVIVETGKRCCNCKHKEKYLYEHPCDKCETRIFQRECPTEWEEGETDGEC